MTTIEIIITMILMIAAVICIFGLAAAFTSKSNIKRDKPPLIPTPSQKNNIRRVYQYPGKEDIYVFWLLTKSIEFAYEELESSLKEYIEQYDLVLDVNKYELEETAQLDKNVDDILKIDSEKKVKSSKNYRKT